MIKSEPVRTLNEKLPELQARDVELALSCILVQRADALAQGERNEIRGFGSFGCRHQPTRVVRNPKMGETVNLPDKVVTRCKPGKKMRDRVDAAPDKCGVTHDRSQLFNYTMFFMSIKFNSNTVSVIVDLKRLGLFCD